MLVAHTMGSHGGQQNFPFGYNPTELHGIGLPDFMTPGPPPGPPILDEHENQELDSFFTGFGAGNNTSKNASMSQYTTGPDQGQNWIMPPTFVGSETSLRPRSGTEWQNVQMSEFAFGNNQNTSHIPQLPNFSNGVHEHTYPNQTHNQYDHNVMHQLHSAAQAVQPGFVPGWPQQVHHQNQNIHQMSQQPRTMMRFGSDSHFRPTGYVPRHDQLDHDVVPNLDWLEADSSTTTTQPNTQPNTRPSTQPNTQPSSPNVSRKRKFDDQHDDSRHNGYMMSENGRGGSTFQQQTQTKVRASQQHPTKREVKISASQLPTPISTNIANMPPGAGVDFEEDADYDEDDEDVESHQRSPSPAINTTKSRSSKSHKQAVVLKPTRPRKKSVISDSPIRPKPKTARSSTGGTPSSRVPLSADQKKANHTNSEQRRRDATARAYAELYDLVPELDEVGKQSTMKKLEIVVAKVSKVKNRVEELRAILGISADGSTNNVLGSSRGTYPSSNTNNSINLFGTEQGAWRG